KPATVALGHLEASIAIAEQHRNRADGVDRNYDYIQPSISIEIGNCRRGRLRTVGVTTYAVDHLRQKDQSATGDRRRFECKTRGVERGIGDRSFSRSGVRYLPHRGDG